MKANFTRLNYLIFILIFTPTLCCNAAGVSDIFIKRHSGKDYDASKRVSVEEMQALIEAARWAPSSHNDQPWHYIFCDRNLSPAAYENALRSLTIKQQGWAVNASLLVITVARVTRLEDLQPNEWGEFDTGAATVSMALQAVDLGLMARQIGGFNHEKIVQDFQIPPEYKPMSIMILGYESSEPSVKLRERNPIDENFFMGGWGEGFSRAIGQ